VSGKRGKAAYVAVYAPDSVKQLEKLYGNVKFQSQSVPPELAVWLADVVLIQTLANKTPISYENAELIRRSAGRLMDILEGRLSLDLH
jgi:hypothetical protein